jgi:peptidase E
VSAVAADGRRHVLAIGGLRGPDEIGRDDEGAPLLLAHAARLTGRAAPRICLLNTAHGDDQAGYVRAYQLFGPVGGRVTHLQLFPMPNTADPGDLLLSQDLIFVGGGSVANMLAVWRCHGLDRVMRQAWEAGIVLSGISAGAICWFSGGTTDSFGPVLRPFTGALGLLAPSYCPHYDSEPGRRPLYQSLVGGGGLPAGVACEDGVAAHYADDGLAEIVTDRRAARAYLVEPAGNGRAAETALGRRFLGES